MVGDKAPFTVEVPSDLDQSKITVVATHSADGIVPVDRVSEGELIQCSYVAQQPVIASSSLPFSLSHPLKGNAKTAFPTIGRDGD